MNGNAMLKPALTGGLVMGLLSALPGISLGNCCCCAWLVTGGLLAAYLLQSKTVEPLALGDGALVGLLAGLFGAVASAIIAVPMKLLAGPFQQRLIQRIAEAQPNLPDNLRQAIDNMGATGVTVAGAIVSFLMMLVLGAIFSTLGGLLGAFFFKKKAASAPPPFTAGPGGPVIDA
jgi:hypothetical protein